MYRARAYANTVRRPHIIKGTKTYLRRGARTKRFRKYRRGVYKGKRFMQRVSRGFPMQMLQRFKTVSESIAVAPAAVFAGYSFLANSIYDPLSTAGVSQPYLYDQLNQFYSKYRVFSGVVKITFINQTANPFMIGICISPDPTAPVTVRDLAQQKGGYKRYGTAEGDGKSKVSLFKAFKVSNYFRNTDIGNKSAAFGANPTELLYIHVRITSIDSTSPDNIEGLLYVELYQNTMLFDYIRQASSDQ